MSQLSDEQLFEELKSRLDENRGMIARIGSLMVELELVNKKLMSSEALKSNFLSNIRNEINNPLAVIFAFSKNLMNDKNVSREELLSIGSAIFKESFSLRFQFDNIFHAADLEAGEMFVDPAQIELPQFFETLIHNFDHLMSEKNIKCNLHTDVEEKILFVTDPDKYSVILSNILDNAIKFSHPNDVIDFLYNVKDHNLVVSIRDEGIGIPDDDKRNIFNRFVQLDTGSTKHHHGHGLGLAVVEELLKLLEGEISVTSRIGTGSNFTVTIPEFATPNEIHTISAEGNEELFTDEEIF